MKKYGVIMGLMMTSSVIFAQQKQDRSADGKHAERMKKELSMTDEQFGKVKSINKDFGGRIFALRKDSTLTKEQKHQKIKSIQDEKEVALKKEMSDDQYKKYKALRASHAGKFKRSKHHFSKGHASRMQKYLSLSDDQTSKIRALDREYMPKFRELRQDSTTSKDDTRKQAQKLRDEYRSKTKSVLTDEQVQKWEAQRKHRVSKAR